METIANFRDLGGYKTLNGGTVKYGRLLRSGELTNCSDEELAILNTEYHLQCIVDFRGAKEIHETDRQRIGNGHYYHIDIMKDFSGKSTGFHGMIHGLSKENPNSVMQNLYKEIVLDETAQLGYKKFFDILLNNEEGAVLFHCFAGKDRTGIGAMLILYVLGVSKKDIVKDYILTNSMRAKENARILKKLEKDGATKVKIDAMRYLLNVDTSYLQIAVETIETMYGSVTCYAKEVLGLNDDKIAILQDKYIV